MLELKTPHTLHFMGFLEHKGARTHAKPRLGCGPGDPPRLTHSGRPNIAPKCGKS